MSTLRAAAQQALEALEHDNPAGRSATITALRAALMEPVVAQQAEPVAWMESPHGAIRANPLYKISAPQSLAWSIPLYTAPPASPDVQRLRDLISRAYHALSAAEEEDDWPSYARKVDEVREMIGAAIKAAEENT